MTNIQEAVYYEEQRHLFEGKQNGARILRDYAIREAFNSGMRQKEIAAMVGLSEGRVKKIIHAIRNSSLTTQGEN